MKIIVTGGAGLIGRPLSEYLVGKGHEVHVIDDFSNSENNLKDPIITHTCDLTQKDKTVELITTIKPDIIYHLACHPYEGKYHMQRNFFPVALHPRGCVKACGTLSVAARGGCHPSRGKPRHIIFDARLVRNWFTKNRTSLASNGATCLSVHHPCTTAIFT